MTRALSDGRWFDVADATKWESTGGTLFYIAGQWATHDMLAALMGNTPATIIDERAAVLWLTSAGFDIPEQLAEVAESLRIGKR